MPIHISWRQDALADLKQFPKNIQTRVWNAVGKRLGTFPALYGTRLRRSLVGLWKLRVGDVRVIYAVKAEEVTIWAVLDRRIVYPEVERRAKGHKP